MVSPSMNFCFAALAGVHLTNRAGIPLRLPSLVCLLCGTAAAAQRPTANAARASAAVVLDGRLDDRAWSAAPAATVFTQQRPNDGEHATERTEVRFLYDDDAIYVG